MRVDAVIVGTGLTGRLAHRVLRGLGLDTVVLGPAGPVRWDPRTIALLPVSVAAMDRQGVDVRPHATALPEMVVESVGPFGLSSEHFRAAEIGAPYLALNVPIGELMDLMPIENALATEVAALDEATDHTTVETADGQRIEARLVVAADGAASPTRQTAGIRMYRQPLGLSALCGPVTLGADHDGICIERYDDQGSVTVIPVGSRNGSLISIAPTERAERLAAATSELLGEVIAQRQPAYGAIRIDATPVMFPLSIGWAPDPAKGRVVAVGEAAHTVPPIGAQGWNMAVRDVMGLAEVLVATLQSGGDLGGAAMRDRYARQRRTDLVGRLAAVGLLAGVATNAAGPLQLLRQMGLGALSRLPGVKHRLMRSGLG